MRPKLTIGIIAYNEALFLPNLLQDIVAQTYPHDQTEIVLVDSGSGDATKAQMERFAAADNGFFAVQVLDNPLRFQAAGWNTVITHAQGEVISRIDAHTHLPADFAEKVMAYIAKGEDVVGGKRPCIIENDTKWAEILLRAENSQFGSSINAARRSEKTQYVKTMFHASYRREVFEKTGLFNEDLLRTEDNEMHDRIRTAGSKLLYDPGIVSYQYARSSLKKMIRQKYLNGLWIGRTLSVCPGCISLYHLVPFAFVLAIAATAVLAAFGIWQFAAVLWGAYALFAVINTVLSSVREPFNGFMFVMPFLYLALHVSYGTGTLAGLLSVPFWKHGKKKPGTGA